MDDPEIRIHPVQAADLPELHAMVLALARHHGDPETVTMDEIARDVLGDHPWVAVLVAHRAGRPVGYAALCPLAKLQSGQRGMDIHHLYVDAALRGQGIGQMLIASAEATARAMGCAYVSVGTHPRNHTASAIYAHLGFETRAVSGPKFTRRLV